MINYILNASVEMGQMVTIIYQKGEQLTKRNIKVIEISSDKVKAYCYLRNQVRVFKLENILSAALYKAEEKVKGRLKAAAGF